MVDAGNIAEYFGRIYCMNILVYMYECGTMFWFVHMYCRICNCRVVLQLQLIFFGCCIWFLYHCSCFFWCCIILLWCCSRWCCITGLWCCIRWCCGIALDAKWGPHMTWWHVEADVARETCALTWRDDVAFDTLADDVESSCRPHYHDLEIGRASCRERVYWAV